MTNRRSTLMTFAAAALISLLLPALASAQNRPWWDRGRDRRDDSYGRSGRDGYYDRQSLRDLSRRIQSRSRDFEKNLDRLLDNSRYDGTRREDRINSGVDDFRRAADRFRDRAGDSNDLNRSAGEARQLLDAAARVNRFASRVRLDSRTAGDWSQLRADLNTVANIYGIRTRDLDDGYYGGDRRDDNYGRDRNRNRRDSRFPRNFPF